MPRRPTSCRWTSGRRCTRSRPTMCPRGWADRDSHDVLHRSYVDRDSRPRWTRRTRRLILKETGRQPVGRPEGLRYEKAALSTSRLHHRGRLSQSRRTADEVSNATGPARRRVAASVPSASSWRPPNPSASASTATSGRSCRTRASAATVPTRTRAWPACGSTFATKRSSRRAPGRTPIVPGDPDKSAIIERIFANGASVMPPASAHKELTAGAEGHHPPVGRGRRGLRRPLGLSAGDAARRARGRGPSRTRTRSTLHPGSSRREGLTPATRPTRARCSAASRSI